MLAEMLRQSSRLIVDPHMRLTLAAIRDTDPLALLKRIEITILLSLNPQLELAGVGSVGGFGLGDPRG